MTNGRASQSTAYDYRTRVCRAMNYISRNFGENLLLEDIAKEASFSMFHFHRVFKAVVGETVAEFTRRIRLEAAANRLISKPTQDITDIAFECGFSSSQNFAKMFKNAYGITPSDFRKSKIGNKESKGGNAFGLQAVYDPDTELRDSLHNERIRKMNAEVKDMPEYNVAYVRKIGPYGPETCGVAFTELMQWAGPKGLIGQGAMLGVYWDNPEVTSPDKCRSDACIEVPEGTTPDNPVALQKIEGGSHAVCHFEVTPDAFQKAWEDAFAWLIQSGRECADRPCYELYHNNAEEHPDGKWIVDICIPLK